MQNTLAYYRIFFILTEKIETLAGLLAEHQAKQNLPTFGSCAWQRTVLPSEGELILKI